MGEDLLTCNVLKNKDVTKLRVIIVLHSYTGVWL